MTPQTLLVSVNVLLPNTLQVPPDQRRLMNDGAKDTCAIKSLSVSVSVSDREGAASLDP